MLDPFMGPAEPLSLLSSGDAERALGTEPVLRRIVKTAQLSPDSRVLVLGGEGTFATQLADPHRLRVTVADDDAKALEGLRERCLGQSFAQRIEIRECKLTALPFGPSEFAAVFIPGRIPWSAPESAAKMRPLLAPEGRFVCIYPVKVGMTPVEPVVRFFERRLKAPLATPAGLLQAIQGVGYEPELIETLSDADLDAGYRNLPASDEAAKLHEEHGSKSSVTFALAMSRRREPGEKPPAARDRG